MSEDQDYSGDPEQKFSYQKIFATAIEKDWRAVYDLCLTDSGFHGAWKKITNAPSEGNHNPNYKDARELCKAVLTARSGSLPPPVFPFQAKLCLQTVDCDLVRHLRYLSQSQGNVSLIGDDAWWLAYYICEAWGLLASNKYKRPCWSGALAFLLEADAFDDLEQLDEPRILWLADFYYREKHWELHPDYWPPKADGEI
jgi:hypothetical protein